MADENDLLSLDVLEQRLVGACRRSVESVQAQVLDELPTDDSKLRCRVRIRVDEPPPTPDSERRFFPSDKGCWERYPNISVVEAAAVLWRDGWVPHYVDLTVAAMVPEGVLIDLHTGGWWARDPALWLHAGEGHPPFSVRESGCRLGTRADDFRCLGWKPIEYRLSGAQPTWEQVKGSPSSGRLAKLPLPTISSRAKRLEPGELQKAHQETAAVLFKRALAKAGRAIFKAAQPQLKRGLVHRGAVRRRSRRHVDRLEAVAQTGSRLVVHPEKRILIFGIRDLAR